jgi:hypothetical protein
MGNRALLLVLVIGLHLVVSAGALPDSPTARRLSGKKEVGTSSAQAPFQDALAKRRALDGAPAGGATECPCLALDSPKLAGVRAIFAELAADFPVRSLLPTTRHSDRTRPRRCPHLPPLITSLGFNPIHTGITQRRVERGGPQGRGAGVVRCTDAGHDPCRVPEVSTREPAHDIRRRLPHSVACATHSGRNRTLSPTPHSGRVRLRRMQSAQRRVRT